MSASHTCALIMSLLAVTRVDGFSQPWTRLAPAQQHFFPPATPVATMQVGDEAIGDTATLVGDDDEEERSPLLDKLEGMEGMWYSDDFYGPHGREWVEVSATLVGAGTSSLVAIKVSGDANVPSGFTTWRTKGLPDVGGSHVRAEIQVRDDPKDPNGFSWVPGLLALVAEDQIALSARLSPVYQSTGTFHKHKVGEGA